MAKDKDGRCKCPYTGKIIYYTYLEASAAKNKKLQEVEETPKGEELNVYSCDYGGPHFPQHWHIGGSLRNVEPYKRNGRRRQPSHRDYL